MNPSTVAHTFAAPAGSVNGPSVSAPVSNGQAAEQHAAAIDIKTSKSPQKFESEPKKEKKEAKPDTVSSRQLVEIHGNPTATALNAAKVRRELSPPTNPFPSVQELVTVRRAQVMEKTAKAKLEDPASDTVDHRV